MQNTRLSNLVSASGRLLVGWLQNPWRRTSVQLLALLGGFFLATAVSTLAGQAAVWDLQIAALLTLVCEGVSALTYRSPSPGFIRRGPDTWVPDGRSPQQALWISALNLLKLGLIFGMFVEAFKLGS